MRLRTISASLFAIGAVGAAMVWAQSAPVALRTDVEVKPAPAEWQPGLNAISADLAREWMEFVAGDETAGRLPGTPGYDLAAAWAVEKFEEWGLEPLGDSFYQQVPLVRVTADASETHLMVGNTHIPSGEFGMLRPGGAWSGSGEIALLLARGEGFTYDLSDVMGKVLFVDMQGTDADFHRELLRAGAAAIVYVRDEPGDDYRVVPRAPQDARGAQRFWITREAAIKVLEGAGVSANFLVGQDEQNYYRFTTRSNEVSVKWTPKIENITSPNVIAVLPGSDRFLREEYVLVGGHLDHLGVIDGDIYYGADDNASGSIAVMMTAKAFAEGSVRPKRSMVFCLWTAEEMGLIGSRYFVENPPVPLDKISAYINNDMVGMNQETDDERPEDNERTIHLINAKTITPVLSDVAEEANDYVGFEFRFENEEVVRGRSDHAPFINAGIPAYAMFSGFHPYYHRPTDTMDRLNYDKIAMTARHNYIVMLLLGDRDSLLPRARD